MRQLIISILLLLPLTSMASAQPDSEQLYWARIKAKNAKERTAIANAGVSIEVVNKDDVVVLAHKDELAKLQKTGNVAVSFEFSALDFPQKDANFHNYAELQADLKELSRNYADIVTLGTIGKTLEGRDIPLITIGKNQNDPSVAAVFFVGGHHAREHISIETPLLVAKNLAAGYKAGDLRITQLLNNRTVYIVPMLNVDGAEFDIDNGSYKSWRKNRRSNGDGSFGVDLNRNYDHQWGTVGASGNTRSETYYGKSAFSEPETQAVRDFVTSHKNITLVHSYHTFSELILYPWGYTDVPVSDQKDFQIHKTMAEKMATWNHYTPQQSSELYLTSGDTCDWAYGVLKLVCFTSELDPKSMWDGGFYPGQAQIDVIFKKNWEPALYMIEYSNNPARVLEAPHKNYGLSAGILTE